MVLHVDTLSFIISAPRVKIYSSGERIAILLRQNHFDSLAR